MNQDDVTKILKELSESEEIIHKTKGGEYSDGEDALSNFKYIALLLGLSPLQVCGVYMTKHYLAMLSHMRNGCMLSEETLESRINDLRLYAALYYALATED